MDKHHMLLPPSQRIYSYSGLEQDTKGKLCQVYSALLPSLPYYITLTSISTRTRRYRHIQSITYKQVATSYCSLGLLITIYKDKLNSSKLARKSKAAS